MRGSRSIFGFKNGEAAKKQKTRETIISMGGKGKA